MKANARVLAKAIAMELVQGAAVALEEEKSYETLGDGTSIVRQRSGLEREVMSRRRAALEIAKSLPEVRRPHPVKFNGNTLYVGE